MSTPPNPLMAQAQQSMQNPMAQAVPQGGSPIEAIANHPLIQQIIKGLGTIAQSYGYTAMSPQERLERTQLDQQKSETMARLGMQQQQLGLEGQRVGIEGRRANTEQQLGAERNKIEAKRTKQEGEYQQGQLGIGQQRNTIEQQRADQEHQAKLKELDQKTSQLEEEARSHKAEEKLGAGRLSIEQKANDLVAQRMDLDKQHWDAQLAMQGKQYDRQLAEDERKQRHASLDEYYKQHSWIANLSGVGAETIQQKHKQIDDDVNQRIGISTNAPLDGQQQGGTKPAKWDGKQWVDPTTGKPIG